MPDETRALTEAEHEWIRDYEVAKAFQRGEFRRLVPDAFDERSVIRPGALPRVLAAFAKAHPNRELVL